MNEIIIKNKLIELFPEAHGFIIGSVDIPVVVSCWINNRRITSDQLEEIKKAANEYLIDFIFKLYGNNNKIRFNVNVKEWKN